MKLRTTILLGVLALIVALPATTVSVVSLRLEADARRQILARLARARAVHDDLRGLRASLYSSEALTIAHEPRLKAVLGTHDIDRATIVDVAEEMQRASAADLFILLDPEGRLLVDVADRSAYGHDLTGQPIVRAALTDGHADGVWTQAQQVLEVHARRLDLGDETVGVLILGHRSDAALARTIARQTGCGVVLVLDGAVVEHALEDADLAAAVAAAPLDDEAATLRLLGERYLARAVMVPGYAGERSLHWVFLESLDATLAAVRTLRLWVYGVAALAVAVASGLTWLLARRISRPVDQLVAFTRSIAAGQLTARADLRGPFEVQALAASMNRMAADLAASRVQLATMERLERELEIALRLQTSILPRARRAPHLELDARRRPAAEVGGDYYDILPVADGCWLGIGDVAGHGLTAGLIMLMVQSVVAMLVLEHPAATPAQLLPSLNTMLYNNIRGRLQRDEHVTFMLLRVHADGRVYFSGAHEDIIVHRAADDACEFIESPGTWLGVLPKLGPDTHDRELRLHPGDLLLTYTDGLTEAKNLAREQYGPERLAAALKAVAQRSTAQICDHLMAEVATWTAIQQDDATVLLLRYVGPTAGTPPT